MKLNKCTRCQTSILQKPKTKAKEKKRYQRTIYKDCCTSKTAPQLKENANTQLASQAHMSGLVQKNGKDICELKLGVHNSQNNVALNQEQNKKVGVQLKVNQH